MGFTFHSFLTRVVLVSAVAVHLLTTAGHSDAQAAGLDTEEWAVVVHADNDADLSAAQVRDMFLRRSTKWGDGSAIEVYQYKENTSQRESFAREVLEMTPAREMQYWVEARVRDGLLSPRIRTSTRVVRVFVSRKKNAIGYIPASEVNDKTRVVLRFTVEK